MKFEVEREEQEERENSLKVRLGLIIIFLKNKIIKWGKVWI